MRCRTLGLTHDEDLVMHHYAGGKCLPMIADCTGWPLARVYALRCSAVGKLSARWGMTRGKVAFAARKTLALLLCVLVVWPMGDHDRAFRTRTRRRDEIKLEVMV